MKPQDIPTQYNHENHEKEIYQKWESSGYFNPDNLPDADARKEAFTIVMPPPNANGSLHAGHALFITLEDIMTRVARMQGKRALWLPGADHAGFETQVVYEKVLEKQGRSRFGMPPEQLYKEIYDFTIENKAFMEGQVRSLGASCDWSREKFTLDPEIVTKVQQTFIKMFNDGLVYRGKRTVNWCSKHQTSLSDVETENHTEKAPFYYFKYGPFSISTVRPETKFGDKYVVMHPDDTRYSQWQHGQEIEVEWINGPIKATIIKDESIDMDFGTGVMTITPWHSGIDFEIAQRHNLDMEQIIDWRGKLLPIAGELAGLNIKDARPKIIERMREKGLLERVDENYEHNIKRCYKCQTAIEPQVKDQWFVKMAPLAKLALDSVDRGEVKFIPDNYEKIFRYWMENALDWNISRQIVWGIPIPAWFCDEDGEFRANMDADAPTCPKCHKPMRKDSDTFDTWFSSGQWPLLTTDYPDGADFARYYPTDIMETGHDLIFKWVPRMIFFGLYLTGKAPFHTVYMHGLVNDAQGKKMSKSKGNVIDPLTLTSKYGTDALRMALIVGNTPGTDLALAENKVKGYRNFANKLWNINRFILQNTEDFDFGDYDYSEKYLNYKKELDELIIEITTELKNHQYHIVAEKLYDYAWHTLADKIIEDSKQDLISEDIAVKRQAQKFLLEALQTLVTALHPFMPFVTEAIYQLWPQQMRRSEFIMISQWPK